MSARAFDADAEMMIQHAHRAAVLMFWLGACASPSGAQDANNSSNDRYALQINGSSCYLYRYRRNSGSQNLGNANIAKFNTGTVRKADFMVLVDKERAVIKLLVDRQVVGDWHDASLKTAVGDSILFQPQNHGNLKISNIYVDRPESEDEDDF